MQCPLCKETVDDDSRYCDQCGRQIMVCSKCGRPGTGKFCTQDRGAMIPAGSGTSTAPGVSAPAPIPQPIQTPLPVQPVPQSTATGGKVKLTSPMHGIMIEAGDGDIIGRHGIFANILSNFKYIGRSHCKIVKTAAGWHIQDLNSTNHTYLPHIQTNPLDPNMLYLLANGTTVKLADVELMVSFNAGDGGTARL